MNLLEADIDPIEAGFDPARLKRIDDHFERYVDDSRLVGWQLALTRGDLSIDVLGRVVEVISGQTLDEFLRTRIFEPLGMVDTGFSVPAEQTGRLAALYGAHPATSLAVPLAAAGASVLQPPSAHLGGGRCDS